MKVSITLIIQIVPLLSSKEWATRIAAGEAIHFVTENIPIWEPLPVIQSEKSDNTASLYLKLETLDLKKILETSESLTRFSDKVEKKNQIIIQKFAFDSFIGLGV